MAITPYFPLLGEPLSLDLVNTRIRSDGTDVDLLDAPAALATWLAAESGRLSWSGAVSAADLHAVRTLRDAIAALLTARRVGARPRPAAVKAVNAALSALPLANRLVWTAAGPRAARTTAGVQRDALLYALALDAVSLLTGPDAALVRTCAHPDCVLQFLARNPRRRWCSASVCGNRARVARHYARHQKAR
jgi:predicted RNA-binding Zn ribbon-like protein